MCLSETSDKFIKKSYLGVITNAIIFCDISSISHFYSTEEIKNI